MCIPQDSPKKDFVFKREFMDFNYNFLNLYGWSLFRSLADEDKHVFDSLHLPTSNEQAEFDEQVGYIVKVLIDSINESHLASLVKNYQLESDIFEPLREKIITVQSDKSKSYRGIDKLVLFLLHEHAYNAEHIAFLRSLYELRSSGSAHIKGDNYQKALKRLRLDKNLKENFSIILDSASSFIISLGPLFDRRPKIRTSGV